MYSQNKSEVTNRTHFPLLSLFFRGLLAPLVVCGTKDREPRQSQCKCWWCFVPTSCDQNSFSIMAGCGLLSFPRGCFLLTTSLHLCRLRWLWDLPYFSIFRRTHLQLLPLVPSVLLVPAMPIVTRLKYFPKRGVAVPHDIFWLFLLPWNKVNKFPFFPFSMYSRLADP